jgi:hypothetical protein
MASRNATKRSGGKGGRSHFPKASNKKSSHKPGDDKQTKITDVTFGIGGNKNASEEPKSKKFIINYSLWYTIIIQSRNFK